MWPVLFIACAPPEAPRPLSEEVYLWQRARGPEVEAAVASRAGDFDALHALAAEVDGGEVTWVPLPDLERLGLVLRVGPGPLPPLQPLIDALSERAAGREILEIQIDYDAASSALPGYAAALAALDAPAPLSCTALPDWLGRPGFDALPCERIVLQVHSLELGRAPEDAVVLDPERARAWAEALDRPARLALPTHGFRLREGRGAREVWADPVEIAGLVAAWRADPPPQVEGLIWFRLPVEGDRMAWSWPTLEAVRRGEAPAGLARAHVEVEGALSTIWIQNDGDADLQIPDLSLSWNGQIVAADALGGARVTPLAAPGAALLSAPAGTAARLRPGERRALAWLRTEPPGPVTADVAAPAAALLR